MAVMICRHLESLGVRPVIFSHDDWFATEYGLQTEGEMEAFTEAVDMVVLGGGGLLIPRHQVKARFAEFTGDMGQLVEQCRHASVPIYGISIGSTGASLDEITPVERRDLLSSVEYISLRNPQDLALLEQARKAGDFFHDIVWTTPHFFPRRSAKKRKIRIGVNLYPSKSLRFLLLEAVLRRIVKARRDVEFVCMDVHPGQEGEFSGLDLSDAGPNCSKLTLTELSTANEEISSLDLIVTTRLHLGMVAMSYGVPSIAFSPQAKTRLLYKNIGLQKMLWESYEIHKFLFYLLPRSGMGRLLSMFRAVDVEPIAADAMKHYEKLTAIVQEHNTSV